MEVYKYPLNIFVAGFIGSPAMNFIPARIVPKDSRLYVDAGSFELLLPPEKGRYLENKKDQEVIFGIRPENIEDKSFVSEDIPSCSIRVTIDVVEPLGSEVLLNVSAGEHSLMARVDPRSRAQRHEETELVLNMDKIHVFEKHTPNLRVKTEDPSR